jgi:hypothetical protein
LGGEVATPAATDADAVKEGGTAAEAAEAG